MESFKSRIERDSIFSARQTIHSLHNTVTNRRVFPQRRFSEKMQKELEQKSNSESQNNQPIIEFLQ